MKTVMNINDTIKVQLTEEGYEIYKKEVPLVGNYLEYHLYEFHLWEFILFLRKPLALAGGFK